MRRDLYASYERLEAADERLREWAFFYRDRRRLESCKSIEHRFRPHSDDFAKEGWGEMETPPKAPNSYAILRAHATNDAIRQLPLVQRWAVTYAYCFPSLQRHLVMRMMKKWTGKRLTWGAYMEQVDLARMKLA